MKAIISTNSGTGTNTALCREEKLAIGRRILGEAGKGASPISNIRKAVASLANKINGKIKNLSAAFKKAWAVIKGAAVPSKVAGVSFGNIQAALRRLTRYSPEAVSVELERDRDNAHDANAIAVAVSVNSSRAYRIGFLPRELAQYMAKIMDSGMRLAAAFKGVTGGSAGFDTYGALIEVTAKG